MTISAARSVGVQSWTFRNTKTLPDLIAQVKASGVTSLELCGAHANFDAPATQAESIAALKAAGIAIRSMGVQTFTGDTARENQWGAFAKAAGVETITAHFKVDSFREAVKSAAAMAEAYDLKIAIHCHGGYMFGGSADILTHLLELGGPRIGLCIDAAWCLQAAGDPVEWVKRFAGRVYGVHYKDFVFAPNGKWSETVIGSGTLDLPAFVQALDQHGFTGHAVIEYEGDPAHPIPAVIAGVAAIKAVPATTAKASA